MDGGHKTVRWSVRVGPPDEDTISVAVRIRGAPASFTLSLTQGFFVEPLLSVAAARAGVVLLPAAGFVSEGGAVLLLGRSRTGKSSVTVRALATGRAVLGDDQLFVDEAASCSAFPRRLRFYSDLPATAPAAYARLPRSTRGGLAARRFARAATRGFVAPPVRVPPAALGALHRGAVPLARVVLVERGASATTLQSTPVEGGDAVRHALVVLREQRTRIAAAAGSAWKGALDAAEDQEGRILRAAFAGASIERVAIPESWDAARAIPALAEQVGAERGPG